MQLSQPKSIRGAIAALTAALLGPAAAAAPPFDNIESSILLYNEADRVSALEGIVSFDKTLPGDQKLKLKLTFDGLTGASPNGATPSNTIQTFTRPSGKGSYAVNPGDVPLDDTFHDTRFAADLSYSRRLNRQTVLSTGAHFSSEFDYVSFGLNGGISREFNGRNTTVSLSGSFFHDQISPEGGLPKPLASMPAAGATLPRLGNSDTKNVVDAVLGVSQIIDRKTIARFNYSFSRSSGYLTDPYKILTMVQDDQAADPGVPLDYLYESRPDSRAKHALFGQVRRYLGGHTVDLSYRYFWDDWGITSHTVDFFYRLPVGDKKFLQPRVRWYSQSEADFYRVFLINGQALPAHASPDYRLANFDALTLELAYAFTIGERSHMKIGAEYYTQLGDRSPPEAFGDLQKHDLFPNLDAFMVRVGYGRDF